LKEAKQKLEEKEKQATEREGLVNRLNIEKQNVEISLENLQAQYKRMVDLNREQTEKSQELEVKEQSFLHRIKGLELEV